MDGPKPFGLVLAGGKGTRMNGALKPLSRLGAHTVLERLLDRLRPKCASVAISIRGDPAPWSGFSAPLLHDETPDASLGPLAGVLAGLRHLERVRGVGNLLLTVPGDVPFVPLDLVERLADERMRRGAVTAMAASGGRTHPAVALWPVTLRASVEQAVSNRRLALRAIHEAAGCATVEWCVEPVDPFFNINTPDDLQLANALLHLVES